MYINIFSFLDILNIHTMITIFKEIILKTHQNALIKNMK